MNPIFDSQLDLNGDADYDEKRNHEVTNIELDDPTDTQAEDLPPVTDSAAMFKKYLVELPDLETADEAVYTWNITNWKALEKKVHSETFQCGGHPWRILFFPYGNQSDHASFYLEHGYEEGQAPEGWASCVQFCLVLSNPNDTKIYMQQSAKHRFQADEGDWGFTRFIELRKLFSQPFTPEGRHLLEDNSATLTAFVRVVKDPTGVLWHNFVNYDSKKETGMVGLKNQGATCYLNSLLQSLYFTNAFRKAVYQIPTENETDIKANSAYALQRLFYNLQMSETAVSTNELTTSFGWESRQVFEQQDVQELSRVLMDRMENKMKGTEAERTLPELFVGQMKTYIKCMNVDYESSRKEDFWDLQLNVRGSKTIDDAFKDYVQVETLEGDNKYHADKFGLQDAKKGVIFEKLPQVLHLQLKRFEYDFQHDTMTKIYDRQDFPETFDASPYLSEDADRSEPHIYHLHGVLVHSGDLNAGHYYAFLKPTKNGDFFRFDDDRVTKATRKEAMNENFGGEFEESNGFGGQQRNPYNRTWTKQRYMSAYMLVYIRESRLDSVLGALTENDIPRHLAQKIQEEKTELERRRKEREEAHLYMQVVVSTDKNFLAWQGFDLFPRDLNSAPEATPKAYRILRSTTLDDFKKLVAGDIGVDADLLRPWSVVGRQNNTIRPDTPLDPNSPTMEDALVKVQNKTPFRVWIETVSRSPEGKPEFVDRVAPSIGQNPSKPILLFLKHFNTEKQTLTGAGHIYVGSGGRVSDMVPEVLERMGWPANTELKLWEEIKANMIEPVTPKVTIAQAELQDGDIICFQKAISDAEAKAINDAGDYADAPKFYEYLLNKVTIHFKDRNNPDSEEGSFSLELSKKMLYNQVTQKVAEYLKAPADHLRFSGVTSTNGKPRAFIRPAATLTLTNMVAPPYSGYSSGMALQSSDSLYYEVLELSLLELDSKKLMRVTLLSEGITKEEIVELLVPKAGTVSNLLEGLQKKLNLSDEIVHNMRLIESHSSKIYRELTMDMTLNTINEFVTIYGEQIPEEEHNAVTGTDRADRAVYAFHFDKEPSRAHNVPFKFIVKDGEPFADTKLRISKRTGIKGKNLEKIKFAIVSRSNFLKPEYLEDDDVLSEKLVSGEDQLGLDHMNKTKSIVRNDAMMIR